MSITKEQQKTHHFGKEAQVWKYSEEGKENCLEFIVYETHAAVCGGYGTTAGLERLTKAFLNDFKNASSIRNQVSNKAELKAMYKCGFRFHVDGKPINNLARTIYNLQTMQSILMARLN